MRTRIALVILLALACAAPTFAQAKKATVVHIDKTVDFAKFHTYSLEMGQPAIVKEVDARIVADIEAELKALGLMKASSGSGDIIVTYYSVTRTDVNLATFDEQPKAGAQRKSAETYKVGTLVVDVKPASKATPAWRAKVEGVLKGDPATQLRTVDQAVIGIFFVYPTRMGK